MSPSNVGDNSSAKQKVKSVFEHLFIQSSIYLKVSNKVFSFCPNLTFSSSDKLKRGRMSTHSFFPLLNDIAFTSPNEIPQDCPESAEEIKCNNNINMPVIWTVRDLATADAIISCGDKLLVFARKGLWEVDFSGNCCKVNADWGGSTTSTLAATELNGHGYAITANGDFWEISLNNYAFQRIGSSDYLTKTRALIAYKDHLLAFSKNLVEVSVNAGGSSFKEVSDGNWSGTLAATVLGDDAYAVTSTGKMFRINLLNYGSDKVGEGWNRTTAIASHNGNLYVFCENLRKVTPDGKCEEFEGWRDALAAVATCDSLYAACGSGDLFKINFE